jgi:2-polyprenyl-3-methyl-5-hydroxy-6-metoxy-1,4-benzoquinol methylase
MHGVEPIDIQSWIRETEIDDERRLHFLHRLLSNHSLLDFGCGTGNFLLKAQNFASEVCGIEPEQRLTDYFKDVHLKVYNSMAEIPLHKKFDIITLFHVLEHLQNPKKTLTGLRKYLQDDGQIIIEVPNADDALLTLYECEPFSNFTYWSCHLFLFNVKTLEMLASQTGLKINYIKQIQRYSLANHLFWLSKGRPGGHKTWNFLDSAELQKAYEEKLADIGKCDTIIMSVSF